MRLRYRTSRGFRRFRHGCSASRGMVRAAKGRGRHTVAVMGGRVMRMRLSC